MLKSVIPFLIIVALCSCTKSDTTTPSQTIVTSDSSNVTGRLYVDFYDANGNAVSNATANLFLTYDDVKRNIPLYTFSSGTSTRVDFGYILEGNYYVTGVNGTNLKDTTVAQVLPKRTITRKLILH